MSIYNDDELVAPAWINKEFLEKVLSKYENNENVEIIKFDMSPASVKGDHYASIMFRCRVNYRFAQNASPVKRSLIIKTLPMEEGMKREMLMESRLFETEIAMYSEMLPKIEKILADCGEPTKLCADLIYHSLDPHKVIVFEDLCELGYNTIRNRFLTDEEIKAVFRKVARLHAVSYMLGHSEESEMVTKYQDGFLNSSMPMVEQMINDGIIHFTEMLSKHQDLAIYHEKITAMKGELSRKCKNLYRSYALNQGVGDIFVIIHGDFHLKNMMFKFSKKNKMEDLIMVDFQGSCYAPANIDMLYSQVMMMSSEMRMDRNEYMLYYFEEFLRILKKIQFKGEYPLYSDFQMANLKYRHFVIFLIASFLPMIAILALTPAEEQKDINLAKLLEDPNAKGQLYEAPAFVEEIRKIMPILLREGYLD
uniref:CHK kinase-like domain-containing protein n=1 Tax=Musca domestica TaxID=7370 RepID=A0A1I8N026_MUSDO